MQHACTSLVSLKTRPVQDICKRKIYSLYFIEIFYIVFYIEYLFAGERRNKSILTLTQSSV